MTKADAIRKVMEDNDGVITLEVLYNEIEEYYPDIRKPRDWKAALRGILYRDVGKQFKRVDEKIYCLSEYDTELLTPANIAEMTTTKEVAVKIRIGQQQFRNQLLKELTPMCPITKIDNPEILKAGHIKPWAMSNNRERLDVLNGFLFSPTFDHLFDCGLISFSNNKEMIISREVNKHNRDRLLIRNGMIISDLPIRNREIYLKYHRTKVLRR